MDLSGRMIATTAAMCALAGLTTASSVCAAIKAPGEVVRFGEPSS